MVVTAVVVTPVVADTNDNSSWKKWGTKGGATSASLFRPNKRGATRLCQQILLFDDLTEKFDADAALHAFRDRT